MSIVKFNELKGSEKLTKMCQDNPLIQEKLDTLESRILGLPEDYVFTKKEEDLLNKLNELIDSEIGNESLWVKLLTKIQVQCKFIDDYISEEVKRELDSATRLIDRLVDKTDSLQPIKTTKEKFWHSSSFLILIIITAAGLSLIQSLLLLDVEATNTSIIHDLLIYGPLFTSFLIILLILFSAGDLDIIGVIVILTLMTPTIYSLIAIIIIGLAAWSNSKYIYRINQLPKNQYNELLYETLDTRVPSKLLLVELPNEYWDKVSSATLLLNNSNRPIQKDESDMIMNSLKEHAQKIESYLSVKDTVD